MADKDTAAASRRRSALAAVYREGTYGRPGPEGGGLVIAERRGLGLALVSLAPQENAEARRRLARTLGLEPPPAPRAAAGPGLAVLWHGPDRWLVVESPEQSDLEGRLRAALAGLPTAAVNDVSHARTVLALTGPRVRDLLAHFTALDLAPAAFPAGAVALTAFGQLSVLLHAPEQDRIDLYVLRSFGQALWEELTEQAAGVGYRVAPAIA